MSKATKKSKVENRELPTELLMLGRIVSDEFTDYEQNLREFLNGTVRLSVCLQALDLMMKRESLGIWEDHIKKAAPDFPISWGKELVQRMGRSEAEIIQMIPNKRSSHEYIEDLSRTIVSIYSEYDQETTIAAEEDCHLLVRKIGRDLWKLKELGRSEKKWKEILTNYVPKLDSRFVDGFITCSSNSERRLLPITFEFPMDIIKFC